VDSTLLITQKLCRGSHNNAFSMGERDYSVVEVSSELFFGNFVIHTCSFFSGTAGNSHFRLALSA
jgi:hypothetical protein